MTLIPELPRALVFSHIHQPANKNNSLLSANNLFKSSDISLFHFIRLFHFVLFFGDFCGFSEVNVNSSHLLLKMMY